MKAVSALCLSLFLFTLGAVPAGAANPAVDSAGNSYFIGYIGSPTYSYSVGKVSPSGELIFERLLDLPGRYPSAIAVDPAGYIYIAGTANISDECCVGSEANMAFVAKLGPDGTGILYESFIWEGGSTEGLDLAVDALGQAYLHYQARTRENVAFSTVIRFSPAGSVNRWAVGRAQFVTAMALGPSGDLITVGWAYPQEPDQVYVEVILERVDASSGAIIETLVDGTETLSWFVDVAATPGNGSVVVGMKSEGLYVAEFGPAGEKIFSRVLDLGALNPAAVESFDVAVTSSGEIVVKVYARSGSAVLRLEGGTGEVISSMNRPPDCSGATASPSVIWPPNGQMVQVSILGVTDPEGKAVAMKVTGITQDEPGAAFSGIGSSVAQVKAERDGKGDGRVYRIEFVAADPSGASCTGEVTVCVPHDRGKGNCVDSNR